MTVSLNKDVDKVFISLCIALEGKGPFNEAQQNILQQGLEYMYRKGLERGRESK